MRPRSIWMPLIILLCAMLATACAKQAMKPVSLTGVPPGVVVALPRDAKHAESDSAVLKESAVVVSLPLAEQFYIGAERFPKEQLGERIGRLLEGQPGARRLVYFAGSGQVDYGNVVQLLDSVRKVGLNTIGLLVERQPGKEAPNLFKVEVLAEPSLDGLPQKPDPLGLLLSIGADGKIELNRTPMGDLRDTATLMQTLSQVFRQRNEQRAFKPGMETRTDLTEDERIEKTIVIKPQRSTNYGQVVRLVDAARGAGASAIILQIDDLAL